MFSPIFTVEQLEENIFHWSIFAAAGITQAVIHWCLALSVIFAQRVRWNGLLYALVISAVKTKPAVGVVVDAPYAECRLFEGTRWSIRFYQTRSERLADDSGGGIERLSLLGFEIDGSR